MSYPVRLPWLLLVSAAIFSADRWTKTWVASHIAIGSAIPVLPGILRISHWLNEGAAFSLFARVPLDKLSLFTATAPPHSGPAVQVSTTVPRLTTPYSRPPFLEW